MLQLKSILNQTYKLKSFVYDSVKFSNEKHAIHVHIKPRKNSKPICSQCGRRGSVYDTSSTPRKFEFLPLWEYPVYFLYSMRRVNCKHCGVKTEKVPWSDGKKSSMTKAYMRYLASWAKILPWNTVASRFHASWEKVAVSVKHVVEWGLKRRVLSGIHAIGVDEIAWRKGHKYLTLVYEISRDNVRLLHITKDRTEESFSSFFEMIGPELREKISYVCSDMWKPYRNVIRKYVPHALHILDRFHIVANLNKALDKIRAEEHRQMRADGHSVLAKKRWLLLKRRENLTVAQEASVKQLVQYNLKSFKAYLLKEEFSGFWEYVRPHWAGMFLNRWVDRVMKTNLEPLKKEAKSLQKHQELLLNWFEAEKQFSSGIVEGLNNKAKVTIRKSYGFRTYETMETSLYHSLGKLPEPDIFET